MISILHPHDDTIIKKYQHAKYMTNTSLLASYISLFETKTLTQLIVQERATVLGCKKIIGEYLREYPSGTPQDITSFLDSITQDENLHVLLKKLLLLGYWRDTTDYADFNLYPSTLEPFNWLMPLLTVDYASSQDILQQTRIDWSAYYYLKFIKIGK